MKYHQNRKKWQNYKYYLAIKTHSWQEMKSHMPTTKARYFKYMQYWDNTA